MALVDNLISYWKLDEASGSGLDALGTNNLVDINTVTSAAGKINTARSFAAASSECLIKSPLMTSQPTGASPFSISAWVKPNGVGAGVLMFFSWGQSTASNGIFLYRNGTTWTAEFGSSSGIVSGGTAIDGAWAHIVVTYSGSTVTLYANGSQIGIRNSYTAAMNASTVVIGSFGAGVSLFWNGEIDEVGAWSIELTAANVTSLYNSGNGFAYPFTPAVTTSRIGRVPRNMASPVGRAQRRMGTPIGRAR